MQSPDPSKGPGSGTYKAREGKLAAVLDESASLCTILGLDEFLFRRDLLGTLECGDSFYHDVIEVVDGR